MPPPLAVAVEVLLPPALVVVVLPVLAPVPEATPVASVTSLSHAAQAHAAADKTIKESQRMGLFYTRVHRCGARTKLCAMRRAITLIALSTCFVGGCSKNDPTPSPTGEVAAPSNQPNNDLAAAELGKAAPDFALVGLDGSQVRLSEHKGKIVVLEWFNPECPFVKQSHTEGELKGMAARYKEQGVVWLAVNSNADGKQGAGADENREGKEKFAMDYPVLFDKDGKVGRAYGAERTPHMYVIDDKGVLVYRGAIDNTKGGDADDVEKVVNYVADAIADVKAGKPVRQTQTEAWGCTVKYSN
jgi:peroxiredoxin